MLSASHSAGAFGNGCVSVDFFYTGKYLTIREVSGCICQQFFKGNIIMTEVTHFLDRFFNPESVAVIGVTDNPYKINFPILKNLVDLNFKGKIYPINSHVTELMGIKTYARLQDVPEKIDLVVSAVPASKTMDLVKDCVELKIKQLVIITGGFSEAGEIGRNLDKKLKLFVKENNIRVLGPNTLSPDNTSNNLIISFHVIEKTKQGGLSFGFQSGFFESRAQRLFTHYGVNKILDMGNKMDINEVDALEYFSKDPKTQVIAMHIESLRGNGRDFFNILKDVSTKKPTIILKSGKTRTGSMAAASHTGAIATENDVIFEFYTFSRSTVILLDNHGQTIWKFSQSQFDNKLDTQIGIGDLDGDGVVEFVAAFLKGNDYTVHILDQKGNLKHHFVLPDFRFDFEYMKVFDTNSDGISEIVCNGMRGVHIFNSLGGLVRKFKPEWEGWHLSLWHTGNGKPLIYGPKGKSILLTDLTAMIVDEIRLSKKGLYFLRNPPIPIKFKGVNTESYIAATKVIPYIYDRSYFYIFNPSGNLIYEEVFPGRIDGYWVVIDDKTKKEYLLVSIHGTIWSYKLK